MESLERRELSEKMDSQSPSIASLKDEIKKLREKVELTISDLWSRNLELEENIASNSKALSWLLHNAGLENKTGRRIILERARQKLARTLHKQKKNCSWEMYVENLSQEEKLKCGASAEMLKEMGSGMYTLNRDVHKDGQPGPKKIWQELFCYVYSKHPEDAEFGPE